jgi:hypothetical protein
MHSASARIPMVFVVALFSGLLRDGRVAGPAERELLMKADIAPPCSTAPAPAILLREGCRENGRVVKRTLANLSRAGLQAGHALRAARRHGRLLAGARGHSRDGKRDDPQIVSGLVCTAEGCPIAVEVFKGNTADPATVAAQVTQIVITSRPTPIQAKAFELLGLSPHCSQ